MFYTDCTVRRKLDRRAGLLRRHGRLRVHNLQGNRPGTQCKSRIPWDSHL